MKKILYFAMITSLAFATSCSKNKDDGTWNTSLGKARFATDKTWEISRNGITQVWSDAVEIIGAKGNYNGGNSTDGYRIDFRSNKSAYKGSLFSWRAVAEVENICPPPWRVPTLQDFINLDKLMGGTGENRNNSELVTLIIPRYLGDWGGAFGGYCGSGGALGIQGHGANYWSQSQSPAGNGFCLCFSTGGNVYPQIWDFKGNGFSLRCVRD